MIEKIADGRAAAVTAIKEIHPPPGKIRHCLSHNLLEPGKTTDLGPFAALRPPGELHNTSKSAVRALDVVELLGCSPEPMRAIDIARAIELSPSSADQLLKTLVDSAYLLFDPVTKRYSPSPRVSRMASQLCSTFFDSGVIEKILRAIHRRIDMQVLLMASQGSFMQMVGHAGSTPNRLDASPASTDYEKLGLRSPMFGSSCGAAWLSRQSVPTIQSAIALCRRELGRQADEPGPLFDLIDRIRRQGFASGGIMVDERTCGVSVPLPRARNGIVLVASVATPISDLRERQTRIVAGMNAGIRDVLGDEAIDAWDCGSA
jgi:DNA-binding IclR family transcriptional regulator